MYDIAMEEESDKALAEWALAMEAIEELHAEIKNGGVARRHLITLESICPEVISERYPLASYTELQSNTNLSVALENIFIALLDMAKKFIALIAKAIMDVIRWFVNLLSNDVTIQATKLAARLDKGLDEVGRGASIIDVNAYLNIKRNAFMDIILIGVGKDTYKVNSEDVKLGSSPDAISISYLNQDVTNVSETVLEASATAQKQRYFDMKESYDSFIQRMYNLLYATVSDAPSDAVVVNAFVSYLKNYVDVFNVRSNEAKVQAGRWSGIEFKFPVLNNPVDSKVLEGRANTIEECMRTPVATPPYPTSLYKDAIDSYLKIRHPTVLIFENKNILGRCKTMSNAIDASYKKAISLKVDSTQTVGDNIRSIDHATVDRLKSLIGDCQVVLNGYLSTTRSIFKIKGYAVEAELNNFECILKSIRLKPVQTN